VDAANAAFVEHFSAVPCKCVDLFLSKSGSGGRSVVDALALFDRNRLALLQLFSFGRNAIMSQPRAVRRALMRMLDKGLQLMDLLEVRVRTWELVELWSGMWLCAWTMPRTKRNARRLGVASLCLSRSLYLMDGEEDSVAAAEYGLNLIQRVTAGSMRLDGVVAGGGGADAGVGADHSRRSMPRRMVRDGALVCQFRRHATVELDEARVRVRTVTARSMPLDGVVAGGEGCVAVAAVIAVAGQAGPVPASGIPVGGFVVVSVVAVLLVMLVMRLLLAVNRTNARLDDHAVRLDDHEVRLDDQAAACDGVTQAVEGLRRQRWEKPG
jgi:hypothetical protein